MEYNLLKWNFIILLLNVWLVLLNVLDKYYMEMFIICLKIKCDMISKYVVIILFICILNRILGVKLLNKYW